MKVAVYNRFWPTMGGGEKLAGAVAQALAGEHEVALLAHEPLDLGVLAERLGLDLQGVTVDLVADEVVAVSAASRRYDLFVNTSYDSVVSPRSRWAIQVVYFPETGRAELAPARRRLGAWGRALRGDGPIVHPVAGLHGPERIGHRLGRRVDEVAQWAVEAPPGARVPIRLALDRHAPAGDGATEAVLEQLDPTGAEPTLLARATTATRVLRGTVTGSPGSTSAVVRLRVDGPVAVTNVVAGAGLRARLAAALPALWVDDPVEDLLARTDRVVAISAFTQRWVERRWGGQHSQVIHPPVTLFEAGTKDPIILSVGRFFPPDALHSKRQLEMVDAFAALVAQGAEGWALHLVGGCAPEHRPYLAEVERRAVGLPVHLHVDAPGQLVAELCARASIYWHAAGLGVDEEQHPRHVEHFGIATAEAMSAGAVPVVVAAGGQVEIVEDGVSGLHVRSVAEITERTAELIADPARRTTMAAAAQDRARQFGLDAFLVSIHRLVAQVSARDR